MYYLFNQQFTFELTKMNQMSLKIPFITLLLFFSGFYAKSIDPTVIKEFENSLQIDILDPFYPAAEDTRGGFIEDRSGTWQNKQDATKYIVAQARYLWMACKAAEFFKDDASKSQIYRSSALHGFEFLKKLWGYDYSGVKGFPVTFDIDGNNGQTTGLASPLYGNAFGLYGISAYYGLTLDPEARVIAGNTYRFLIKYGYDAINKGFFRSSTDHDKDIDYNMHVLEGMVEFYKYLPANDILKDSVKQSVAELLGVIHDKVIRDIGGGNYCAIPLTNDSYTRASNLISFGHDIELGFLMIEAMKAIGIYSPTHLYMTKIKKMVDFTLNSTAYKSDGSLYYAGSYSNGVVTITNSMLEWWPQAEALNTLCLFTFLYPENKTYETKFWLTWNCIKNHFIDQTNHGWVEKYDNWGAPKTAEYHCNYHNGRALENCITLLRTAPVSKLVQAESYISMSGVQTETTADIGGGLNVGWITTGDWMTYSVVVPQTGNYSVDFRVSGWTSTGSIALQNSSNTTLTSVIVPNGGTGAYQKWSTVSGTNSFPLTAGTQTFRIYATGPSWNINWFELKLVTPSVLASIAVTPSPANVVSGSSLQFAAVGKDKYGNTMAISPSPKWTATGGTISSSGLYTAGETVGSSFSVTVQSDTIVGVAQVSVTPAPLLTTITLSPASVSVNVGSSQQFTAVGKDQYGNVIAINPVPVWTASGGTIDATGLFTAGSIAGTYSVSAQSGTVIGTANVNLSIIPLMSKIEAENYSTMYGVQIETTSDAGGGLNVGWIAAGDWMTYSVNIPQSGTYSADFRVSGWTATGTLALQNGSNTTLTNVTVPNGGTGAYQVWSTVAGNNTFQLSAGAQTLRIYATGPSWNINWFELKLQAPSVLTSISVTPSPASVINGSTLQFSTTGKDQYGNAMVIAPIWSVTGGGSINESTGLFTANTVGGPYTVTATSGSLSGTANVTVNPVSVDPLTLSYFLIVDKWTGDYMRPTDGLATAAITQYESATVPTSTTCQWEFRSAPTSGYYYILNRSTGYAIQPTGGSTADNTGMSQVALTALNQNNTELQWLLQVSDEPTFYWIKNLKSGLGIRPASGTNGTGIAIVQNTLTTTYSSFKWSLVSQGLKSAIVEYSTDETFDKRVNIYPNPANDLVNIETSDHNFSIIEVRSASGAVVITKPVSDNLTKLNISSLNKGLYLVTLRGNTKSITQKLIIR
jgi:mannose/cellobiose epimerase-like protein (N-acyl-D-glucosamine 2-epimerase family)